MQPQEFRLGLCGRGDVILVDQRRYTEGMEALADHAALRHGFGHALGRDRQAFPEGWRYRLIPVDEIARWRAVTPRAPMFRYDNARIEGYWRLPGDRYADHLPEPVANAKPWPGQGAFLSALSTVERSARGLERLRFMGSSHCRLCGRTNGASEFFDPRPDAAYGWRWPDGFRHYVEEHNVEPSDGFLNYIVWRSRNLR